MTLISLCAYDMNNSQVTKYNYILKDDTPGERGLYHSVNYFHLYIFFLKTKATKTFIY